jgi:hypothetical protein
MKRDIQQLADELRTMRFESIPVKCTAEGNPRNLILENLALSFVRVDEWVMRFFLEDLAIGLFRPLFNIHFER